METFSALLAICADEFPSQRPVTRSFYVFFDLCPKKKVEETMAMLVIWDAIVPIVTSL